MYGIELEEYDMAMEVAGEMEAAMLMFGKHKNMTCMS